VVILDWIRALGFAVLSFVDTLGKLGVFAFEIVFSLFRPPVRGWPYLDELYKLGVLSLVIICVSGLAVGMVLGLQGYNSLARFGAEESLGGVVGLTLIRELGPVLTALLTTGRAGSATTAEIASMNATEQLDGLRMMSVNPIDFVVAPRAMAMITVLPLLSALLTCSAILGGYIVAVALMREDGGVYLASLEWAVVFDDVVQSMLKAVVFGALVGRIATYRGYTAEPTSAGVSSATTSTVVVASVTILIVDYFITALWGV
jgi:phospholipid/cholesterol/gamma-HCH transport system permease protein